MANFLLIHGSAHGAWCWRDVIARLEAMGHTARAIDLPGSGDDPTPVSEVTLDSYRDAILAAIDRPVVLVGHSAGGFAIAAAAEAAPDKIARLVYVCAYAPVTGLSLADMRRAAPRQPLVDAIEKTADGLAFTFKRDTPTDHFFHDCDADVRADALARLGPQPIAPQDTPITLTDRYAGVPKRYIRCADDRAIAPEHQAQMTQDWPPADVVTLPSSHSPFLSMPERLAELLVRLAAD